MIKRFHGYFSGALVTIASIFLYSSLALSQSNVCDPVYDNCVLRSQSYYVDGAKIHHRGKPLKIKGINWFGLETDILSLHGLWTGRSMESFVDQIKDLGFNALRIPLAPEALDPSSPGRDGYSNPTQQIKALLHYTERVDMHVVLSIQKCSKWNRHDDKPGPGLGVCSSYSEDQWLGDLKKLAALSNESSNVLGIDLFNEPYGFTWDRWRQMATKGGEAVLRVNPRTLVFVEGVANESTPGNYYAFWGENLFEAGSRHVEIPVSRLVFSPHVYGPSVSMQDYFKDPRFPINLSGVWYQHFGYMAPYWPIVIGEFGGRYEGIDKTWGDELVRYLINENMGDFFYWGLNPNSGDTGGLLKDDWKTVDESKLFYLRRLLLR